METFLPTINIAKPEVVFLDLALAVSDPLDAVRRVHRAAPGVPLIVFADVSKEDSAAQCLRYGALAYLLKGFMDLRTVERVLGTALERNTLKGLTDLLRDLLTGLHLRDGFLTLGRGLMESARRKGGSLILLCAQIENLRAPHAEFVSSAVDRSLCEAAGLLAGCLRCSDLVAHIGEGQFAALAADAAEPSVQVLRQRLEKRLSLRERDDVYRDYFALRTSAGFWCLPDSRSFEEFFDGVEADLRVAITDHDQQAAMPEALHER